MSCGSSPEYASSPKLRRAPREPRAHRAARSYARAAAASSLCRPKFTSRPSTCGGSKRDGDVSG